MGGTTLGEHRTTCVDAPKLAGRASESSRRVHPRARPHARCPRGASGHPDWRGRRARRGALRGRVDPAANARVVCVDTTVTARRIATASTRRGSRHPRLDPGVHRDRARAKGFSSHRRSSPEKRARDDTPSSHIASRAPRRSRARELTILAEQNRVGTACAATKGRRCRRPWREIPPGPTSHQICGEIVQLVPMWIEIIDISVLLTKVSSALLLFGPRPKKHGMRAFSGRSIITLLK